MTEGGLCAGALGARVGRQADEPGALFPQAPCEVVVLGLVTTKRPRLETEQDLKRRIADAARIIPLERLALSPQCGFASTMEGNKLSQNDQRAKLELVARVARSVG